MTLSALACLNLNGHLGGDCLYKSESFGELSGYIEFNIIQNSCEEIQIDGAKLQIPGSFEQVDKNQNDVQTVKLAARWTHSDKLNLAYKYELITDRNGKRVDEVLLNGNFTQSGKMIVLKQTGSVDSDPVQVECRLSRL